jgi:hypothetical protein
MQNIYTFDNGVIRLLDNATCLLLWYSHAVVLIYPIIKYKSRMPQHLVEKQHILLYLH